MVECWHRLGAVELVVEEVRQELDGEDPLVPELANAGLKPKEITHVAKWPPGEREKFLEALVAAISAVPTAPASSNSSGVPYGDASETLVDSPLPGAGDINVTFRSPFKKVRKSMFTQGEIFVDI